ncbi:MAG: mechanosensitive ion channel family protein [Anaerolineales bacterium]|jgi:MscS family membrane protein
MDVLGLTTSDWIELGWSVLAVLLTALLGYRLIRWILRRVLGIITSRTSNELDNQLLSGLSFPSYFLVLVLVTQFVVERLSFLPQRWAPTIDDVFYALYALVIFSMLWRSVHILMSWYAQEVAPHTDTHLDEQMVPFFRRLALIALLLIFTIVLLSHYKVDVSGLVATLGVGSLAVALAAKETLSDTLAGFVIMVDRPFRIGDRIEIQDLSTWGDVVDIGLRSSRIRTRDNRMVIIPNSIIGKSLIVNHAYPNTEYRIEIHIGVDYGVDIEQARRSLIEAVSSVKGVLSDHPVEALFLEFGDSALIFRVRWWIESYVDTRRMFDKVNTAIYHRLKQDGIGIPYPQRVLHHQFDSQSRPLQLERVNRPG